MDAEPPTPLGETRPPSDEDLANLARALNEAGAKYIVIGGFAINAAGYIRSTMDIDLLVDTSVENDEKVREALTIMPEKAILELGPGEIQNYGVVRVCDEFTVDLMAKACGLTYGDAKEMIQIHEHHGVKIPFASPILLWKTKQTYREKDEIDRVFLRRLLIDRGEWPVT
jgi:hypothetical protein